MTDSPLRPIIAGGKILNKGKGWTVWTDSVALAAGIPRTYTLPDGAVYVYFTCTGEFYAALDMIPVVNGEGTLHNPVFRAVGNASYIGFVSKAVDCQVEIQVFGSVSESSPFDPTAFHWDIPNEITSHTPQKITPSGFDNILAEDSANGFSKIHIPFSSFSGDMVKASDSDPTAGFLDAKVDGITIDVNNLNKLTVLAPPCPTYNASYVLTPADINRHMEMFASVPTTFTLLPATSPTDFYAWNHFINAGSSTLTLIGRVGEIINPVLGPLQEMTIVTDGNHWHGSIINVSDVGTDNSTLPNVFQISLANVTNGLVAGMRISFIAAIANTDFCSLQLNSLPVKPFYKSGGTALSAGDILASQDVDATYDGVGWQMQSPPGTNNFVDSYKVLASNTDSAPGYLSAKVDGVTVLVNSSNQLVAPGGGGDTYMVKMNSSDPVAGYLADKIDNYTIVVDNSIPTNPVIKAVGGTNDLQAYHRNVANEIYGQTANILTVDNSDYILGEQANPPDPYTPYRKVSFPVSSLARAGMDTSSFHYDIGNEFSNAPYKATPVGADRILLEDSGSTRLSKAWTTISQLPISPDTYKVKAASGDLNPDFLSGKVDNSTITVDPVLYQLKIPLSYSTLYSLKTDIQGGNLIYADDIGTIANNFIVNLSPPLTSYRKGAVVRFKALHTITGGVLTLNVNSLGVKNFYKFGTTPFLINEILATQMVEAVYDGINFQCQSILNETALVDSYKVMADASDPTPDYLSGKVDNVTITVTGNKLVAIGGHSDSYTVKASGTDPNPPGFLIDKIDGTNLVIDNNYKVNIGSTIPLKTDIQQRSLIAGTDIGTANHYNINLVPAPLSITTNTGVSFIAANANTGASDLTVNGLGPYPLRKIGDQDLSANDIRLNQVVDAVFDGSAYQITSLLGNASVGKSIGVTGYDIYQGMDASIGAVTVYNPGINYSVGDVLTIVQPEASGGTVTVTSSSPMGMVYLINGIPESGPGYQVNDVLTLVQSGASGATAKVTAVESNGAIDTVELLTGGQGYSAWEVPTTGGHGSGCWLDISYTTYTGGVLSVSLTSGGSTYKIANNLPTTGGLGSGCTINITELSYSSNVLTFRKIASPSNPYQLDVVFFTPDQITGDTLQLNFNKDGLQLTLDDVRDGTGRYAFTDFDSDRLTKAYNLGISGTTMSAEAVTQINWFCEFGTTPFEWLTPCGGRRAIDKQEWAQALGLANARISDVNQNTIGGIVHVGHTHLMEFFPGFGGGAGTLLDGCLDVHESSTQFMGILGNVIDNHALQIFLQNVLVNYNMKDAGVFIVYDITQHGNTQCMDINFRSLYQVSPQNYPAEYSGDINFATGSHPQDTIIYGNIIRTQLASNKLNDSKYNIFSSKLSPYQVMYDNDSFHCYINYNRSIVPPPYFGDVIMLNQLNYHAGDPPSSDDMRFMLVSDYKPPDGSKTIPSIQRVLDPLNPDLDPLWDIACNFYYQPDSSIAIYSGYSIISVEVDQSNHNFPSYRMRRIIAWNDDETYSYSITLMICDGQNNPFGKPSDIYLRPRRFKKKGNNLLRGINDPICTLWGVTDDTDTAAGEVIWMNVGVDNGSGPTILNIGYGTTTDANDTALISIDTTKIDKLGAQSQALDMNGNAINSLPTQSPGEILFDRELIMKLGELCHFQMN